MLAIYLQMIPDEREHAKFERVYEKYKNLMFRCAKEILGNDEDAEDAVNMAFISIAKNITKITDVNSTGTKNYVAIIAERKAIDVLRKRKSYADIGLDESIVGVEITMPDGGGLAAAIAKLNERYRAVILLHYVSGYSTKEMAKMLDMKVGTMQKTLYRAKEALRKKLEEEGISV